MPARSRRCPSSARRGAIVARRVALLDEERDLVRRARGGRRQRRADVLADHVRDERDAQRGGVVVGPGHDDRPHERPRDGDHHEQHAGGQEREEQDEPEDPGEAAATAPVALVLALVAGTAAVAAGPLVAVAVPAVGRIARARGRP